MAAVLTCTTAGTVAASIVAPATAGTGDPVIAAAGDIACPPPARPTASACHQNSTAAILTSAAYAAVLAVGDEQYPCGLLSDFKAVYDPSWGVVKGKTYPIPGDNEYVGNNGCTSGPGADGYFTYFGDVATPLQPGCRSSCRGYYSVDIGAWHVIALNSECNANGVGGCGSSTPQYKWLVADLKAHPTTCTLAMFHKPYWANGRVGGATKPLVQALYNGGADVLLSGHNHLYMRYAPQTPSSEASPYGIREFVVGTGGINHAKIKSTLPNLEFRQNTDFGVLELTLHATSYDWRFLSDKVSNGTYRVLDSGTQACH